jgi:hypothetical protein
MPAIEARTMELGWAGLSDGVLMRSQDGPHRETNSLSLRERARVRGKAARNRQGPGALPGAEFCSPSLRVIDFIGSLQARCFAERFFPLTPALSPRRGRTVRCAFANSERLDSSPRGMRCSLRERERGVWEIGDRFQAMFSRLSPLPGPLHTRSSRGEGEDEAPPALEDEAPPALGALVANPADSSV